MININDSRSVSQRFGIGDSSRFLTILIRENGVVRAKICSMESNIHHLIKRIHDLPAQLVLVTAGAGTKALSDLLGVPGASRTVLEALVPYSVASFDDFLGRTPKKYVTAHAAKFMAGRAYTRARWLNAAEKPAIGLACTATIVTDRPKRGEHRAHIATWQPERLSYCYLNLEKGARDRSGEEALVSHTMLHLLMQAFALDVPLSLPLLPGDRLEQQTMDYAALAQKLHARQIDFFMIADDGRIDTKTVPPVIFSGAFNPLHEGHLQLSRVAAELTGKEVAFELAAVNVDKPPLAPAAVLIRTAQFAGRYPVLVSNAPTFIEKARLYPRATFVVGYDTADRILASRYYDNDPQQMLAALHEIARLGCHFLVAGRVLNGDFRTLDSLNIPADLHGLFQAVPASRFRKDISSSYLRATGQRGSR